VPWAHSLNAELVPWPLSCMLAQTRLLPLVPEVTHFPNIVHFLVRIMVLLHGSFRSMQGALCLQGTQ